MTTTCERKTRYLTEGLALQAARGRSKGTGEVIKPYQCPECGGWHIGHPRLGPPRGLRRGRRGRR